MKKLLTLLLISFTATIMAEEVSSTTIAKGKWHFEKRCAFCHERQGQGGVGPNLTDDYYIYGSDKKTIDYLVRNGIAAKGMPEWQKLLPKDQVDAIIEYVWSIQGKNIKGKAPEGVKLVRKEKK
ncbi:MAG: c-type cytochrome [Lentisphaeraceae bacterium]|nr:c-type cytochrome [Lentisphaeraceae bacterium]